MKWPRRARGRDDDGLREIDEELRLHIDGRTQELMAAGHPPEDARRRALDAFGDYDAVRGEMREIEARVAWRRRAGAVLAESWRDVRLGARRLRRIFPSPHRRRATRTPQPQARFLSTWGLGCRTAQSPRSATGRSPAVEYGSNGDENPPRALAVTLRRGVWVSSPAGRRPPDRPGEPTCADRTKEPGARSRRTLIRAIRFVCRSYADTLSWRAGAIASMIALSVGLGRMARSVRVGSGR